MRKGIFSKLAVQNIRNNKSTYIPYMITCIFCIAMIYMMEFLRDCPTLDQAVRHAAEVRMILSTVEVVVVIFCVIFLIYSNSFLMKRRQKEIGLYNILGLERNHIGIVLLLETIFTTILSLTGGIAIGILASKLSLLLLLRLLYIPAVLGFYISTKGIITCLLMFGAIFLLILLLNLRRIHLSRPVELLRGNNTGEREPKAKWLMALLGFICLGIGYYLAITTESPIKAITIFLLAVILVMAGTYLLFTAGSIVILKFLRRRKSFYYKTGNFISISGMLYRMKQNAVGLASICILSTGVLLMISMTVSIYFGMNDIMVNRYPYDTDISITGVGEEECQTAIETFEKAISDNKVPVDKKAEEIYLTIISRIDHGQIQIAEPGTLTESGSVLTLSLVRQSEYEKLTGTNPALQDGEILAWASKMTEKSDSLTVNDSVFSVKKWLENSPLTCGRDIVYRNAVFVVTDSDFEKFDKMRTEMYKNTSATPAGQDLTVHLGLDITGSDETIAGNVFIGAGETETVRLFAQAAQKIQKKYPDIQYHISSGNAEHVLDYLDKGLIDFGLLFTKVDPQKYEALPMPVKDTWGVLMRKDFPLAKKEAICPEDLWDKPLIISHQKGDDILLDHWLRREKSELHIVATYNLLFNASLLVDEGLGYALGLDNIINTQSGNLCFRPLSPRLEVNSFIVWKKYQVFSKAANLFLRYLQDMIPLIGPSDPNIQGSGSSR